MDLPRLSIPGPGRIAYVNDDTTGWSIHVVDGDGTNDHVIADFPLISPNNPSWSSDGTRLVFDAFEEGSSIRQIYVLEDDGSNVEQITSDPGGATDPAWSPDGSRIAFVSTRDGNPEIYVMDADGSDQVRLTDHAAADLEPAWSPDSIQLAFSSERDGEAEIYTMLANGSNQTRLTTDAVETIDSTPAWSPSGQWIAFCSRPLSSSGQFRGADIHIMNTNGSGIVNLTKTNDQHDCGPTWSSDSTRIVYSRGARNVAPSSSVLFSVGVDGAEATYLVGSWRYNFSPAWLR
ncbi:MAG TPA: hypothetical protein VGD58_12370 [Herpetosiphonaceae bacterium]